MKAEHRWVRVGAPDGFPPGLALHYWFFTCSRCAVPAIAEDVDDVPPSEPTHPEWQWGAVMGLPAVEAAVDWRDCDACLCAKVLGS